MKAMAIMLGVAVVFGDPVTASDWRQYEDPSKAGWSLPALDEARRTAEQAGSAAVMVVEDGVVVAAWGSIEHPLPIYSMRKGIYNALVGMLVAEEKIDLEATLADLEVEEIEALTEVERSATVEDLLAARSGVYQVSAYEPASMKRSRPKRGAYAPGEQWFYNNWDFNLLAHLLEQASGQNFAALFDERLAEPLGMEDFTPDDVFSFLEPSRSRYPAVIFNMSARDLARFGQVYLDHGNWQGERLLDPAWIDASWTPRTVFEAGSPFGAGNGFGYLWWIYPARDRSEQPFARHDAYLTRGSDGQVVVAIPDRDLLVVHQTVAEDASFDGAVRVINAVLRAKQHPAPRERPALVALDPSPLGEPPKAPERRTAVPWTPDAVEALTGEYFMTPEVSFVVHELDGRLFALPRGAPLAEVELFVNAGGTMYSPAVDVILETVTGDGKRVIALEGFIEGRPVRLEREIVHAD